MAFPRLLVVSAIAAGHGKTGSSPCVCDVVDVGPYDTDGGSAVEQTSQRISIRPLTEGDLPEAGGILRRAFATHFGMPPDTFWTDRDFVTGRWMTDPSLAFGAWIEDRLVGSSLGANWGSLGVFGPISTHPDTWNRGTARHLIPPVLERLKALGARHIAFFTFAESTKHIALYQKLDFWPRFLTAIMTRPVEANESTASLDSLLNHCQRRSGTLA